MYDKTGKIMEETKKPAPKKPAPKKPAPKKEKQNTYTCTKNPLIHPFKNVTIGKLPVELFPDSWLDSQVKAGLVKCQ